MSFDDDVVDIGLLRALFHEPILARRFLPVTRF